MADRIVYLLLLGLSFPLLLQANRNKPPEYELLIIQRNKRMPKLRATVNQGDQIAIWLKDSKEPIKGLLTGIESDSISINLEMHALESIGALRLSGDANRSRADRSVFGFLTILAAVPLGIISGVMLSGLFTGDFDPGIINGFGVPFAILLIVLGIRMIVNSGKYKANRYSFISWEQGVPFEGFKHKKQQKDRKINLYKP